MVEFNRKRVLENVNSLLQQRQKKVGDLERALGVSAGYISRLSKEGNESALSAEFICKAAQYFGVSIDSLVRTKIDREDKMISYMREFIGKLVKTTEQGDQSWTPIYVPRINNMLMGRTRVEFPACYYGSADFGKKEPGPSNSYLEPEDAIGAFGHFKVVSAAYDMGVVVPCGTVFHTNVGGNHELYLACYYCDFGPDETIFYELMLVDQDGEEEFYNRCDDEAYRPMLGSCDTPDFVSGVCNTFQDVWAPINDDLTNLYSVVKQHEMDIQINPNVKGVLDRFMQGVIDDDDLPF